MYSTTTFVSTIYSLVILSCTYCICAYSELSNGPSSPRAELSTVRAVHRPNFLRSELSTGRGVHGPSYPQSELPTVRGVSMRAELSNGLSSPRSEWSTGWDVYFMGWVVNRNSEDVSHARHWPRSISISWDIVRCSDWLSCPQSELSTVRVVPFPYILYPFFFS
jgi:hypothetical protein